MALNNLLVLTRNLNKDFTKKLNQARKNLEKRLFIMDPSEFSLPIENFLKSSNSELPRPDDTVIWNRVSGIDYCDYDLLVAKNWQDLGANLVNSIDTQRIYRDKFCQYLHLKKHQVPTLDSYYLSIENIDMLPKGGPYVAKTLRGAKGRGVIRLENIQAVTDFLTLTESINDTRFIIQQYRSFEQEHRYFIFKGEVVGHIEKTKVPNSWKHGFSVSNWKDGKGANNKVSELVKKIDSIEKKFFYAVDIIFLDQMPYVLEVNLCPGVNGLDQMRDKSVLEDVLMNM